MASPNFIDISQEASELDVVPSTNITTFTTTNTKLKKEKLYC
jgi:hypothetical protein